MNRIKLCVGSFLTVMALTGSAEWQYVAVGAAGSKHPDKQYITDGNWELKVVSWDASSFQTSGTWANSYLAGSGTLDLAAAQSDLGRTLSPAGHYGSATQITELVLPDEIALLAGDDYPDAKAAYAAGKLLGTWQTGGTARMWFVKYCSPHRSLKGLSVLIK